MSHNKVGNKGAFLLMELISTFCPLKSLSLAYCGLTDLGGNEIWTQMRRNKNLEELDLSGNSFSQGQSLSQMLTSNHSLKKLSLSHCQLQNKLAQAIVDGLSHGSLL
mmetsp:Transcript_33478/g.32537  ORF Transcript_33478/g.32537 Transcript_33478/m.32537 type:complete len:107 (+) Transcript_33478:799-1119(+)